MDRGRGDGGEPARRRHAPSHRDRRRQRHPDPGSWDVHDLVGHTAQLQVVDNATGAWGHLLVDQILFADTAGASYGDPDRQTTVNLVVGGQVVRTATGQDSEHLTWASWNVAGLIGETASIRIVDNSTTGWGHVLADAISFDDRPAA